VLYEIAVGKKSFAEDWAVFHYATSSSDSPPQVVQHGTEFYRHHLNGVLGDLLSRDPQQRPKISTICSTFDSYGRVFELSTTQPVYGSSEYPSHQEWKEMSESDGTMQELHFRVAKDLLSAGEWNSAKSLLREIAVSFDGERPETNPFTVARLQGLPPTIIQEIGYTLINRGRETAAIIILKAAIQAYPKIFDLQRILAEFYLQVIRRPTKPRPSDEVDKMFTTAFTSYCVPNPRLLYREFSIVYLEAGLEPPALSTEQEKIVYP
jgi:hypothetical protein